ncbi:hypothetical protein [Marinobacter sp.]|uniref:hypothetical protein n=1 Tax=Marinobacter sp. TaxID=50741 RepID=UPI003563DCFB
MSRNLLASLFLSSSIFLSVPSPANAAGIPVIDGTSVTLALRKLVTDVKSWARDEALKKAGMENDLQIAKNQEATDTNIAANTIVRITDALEETHNQAMDAQVTPSFMACKNVSVSRARKSAESAARDTSWRAMADYWNSELTPPGTSLRGYRRARNAQLTEEMDAINSELSGTGKEQAFSRADVFLRLGPYSNDLVYSDTEVRSSKLFVDLLVGPYSERAELLLGEKSLEELTEKERIELARATIRKGAVRAVLEKIRSDYLPDDQGNSLALAREDFIINSRFGNDEWHKKITCTSQTGDPGNCANDSIVLKEIAVMMGQELELANEILKQKRHSNMLLSLLATSDDGVQ